MKFNLIIKIIHRSLYELNCNTKVNEDEKKKRTEHLQDADDGSTVIREIMNTGDNIRSVKETLSMSRHEHKEAHERQRHRWKEAGDSSPHKKIAQEALGRAQ